MMLSKIQYISQGKSRREQEHYILQALSAGVDWVQVRWKDAPADELLQLSRYTREACRTYGAICIINDHISIAKEVDADGVHLGLDDAPVAEAKQLLGADKIIGGTANTVADIQQRIDEGCDYIGVGPYRFTTTKQRLSPLLRPEGYRKIIAHFAQQGITLPPIYAIGGIGLEDLAVIKHIGVYGVALSGLISQHPSSIAQLKKCLA